MTEISAPDGGEDPCKDQSNPPSMAVVEAIAEKTETGPMELPPLYEAIDPDALDQLFAGRDNGTVSFSCCGYEVTVEQDGKITIHSE